MRDLFQHRYYRINKMLLSFFGLWPYQTIRTRSVLVASTFVFSFSAMVPQVIAIVNHFDDWDLILDSVTSLTFDSFFLTKLFFTVFNSQKVSVIFFKAWSKCRSQSPSSYHSNEYEVEKQIKQIWYYFVQDGSGVWASDHFELIRALIAKLIHISFFFLSNDRYWSCFSWLVDCKNCFFNDKHGALTFTVFCYRQYDYTCSLWRHI